MLCWVLSDSEKIGSHNQGIGLGRALGFLPTLKKISPHFPWSHLPPGLWVAPLKALKNNSLCPPWPVLLITAGRAAAAPAAAIRKKTGCFTICLMNPHLPLDRFDIVIVPEHDKISGSNVIQTLGALHSLTEHGIQEAAQSLASTVTQLPRPYHVFLLGGDSPHCTYTQEIISEVNAKILATLSTKGGSLLITPSRRTPPGLLEGLQPQLQGLPHFIWDGKGQNPYHGFLGLADNLYVTSDSISMVGEACFTGKPVYILDVHQKTKKFESFFTSLYERHHARPFDMEDQGWIVQKLDENRRILPLIQALMPLFPIE